MDIHELLFKVKNDEISIEDAKEELKKLPYEDLGFAKLDHHRKLRSGFGEVIYCSGKSDDHLIKIFQNFNEKGIDVLGTRASKEQYLKVQKAIPEAEYDELSRIIKIVKSNTEKIGCIAICTGGTSDIPIAEEAAQTAEFFGSNVIRIYDVGVAGIHRLLSKMDEVRKANCVVAVAGMEGALPGVIAGMIDKPVIAVPTSIGYGANFQGLSSLLTMLNSCAEGISVVNIDNGFGAGYISTQINRLAVKGNV
ncbi:nickel pincer cofactor biosynthesis protein LarB [Anaerosalibacter sp. Marseille-P3206]|uniref:nickel pincer cofactor biosynthesis protein LarB n=1 Tax=Anaerosalibacter sp. Marseille-P3206 TaxID=1871005 RepID=UPI00098673E5|nr:nickel pincer cofactor biosynthesis protein LarB [Anaerosalibacter sp. Marseille-P3206]